MKFKADPEYFLDSIHNGAFILDDELKVCYWNKWMEAHTSMDRSEVTGKALQELFPEINVNQLKRKIRSMRALKSHTYYDAGSHGYLLKIKSAKYTNSVYEYMKQNVVISPIDEEMKHALIMIYDQTPLFETQKMLEENESFLRAVFARSISGIVVMDMDKNIFISNRAFQDMLQLGADEVTGTRLDSFLSDEDKKKCLELHKGLLSGEIENFTEELLFTPPEGKSFWGTMRASLIKDRDANPVYCIATVEDITENKRIYEELEKNRDYLQKVLDFQASIIVVTDGEKILNCNRSFLEFTGYESLEDYSNNLSVITDYFEPDENTITGETREGWLEEVFQNYSIGLDSKVKMRSARDGAIRTYQIDFRILPMTAGEYIVSFTDITDMENYQKILRDANRVLEIIVGERTEELQKTNDKLESSSRQLSLAQEIAGIGSWEIVQDETILRASEEVFNITGLENCNDNIIEREMLLALFDPADRERISKAFSHSSGEDSGTDIYAELNVAEGEKRILHIQSRFFPGTENAEPRIIGTLHDITEIKKAEVAVRRNERLLSSVFDFAAFGVCLTDTSNRFLRVNKTFCDITGINEEKLTGMSLEEVMTIHETKAVDENTSSVEWAVTMKDGRSADLLVSFGELNLEEDGHITVYSFADITEKNSVEKLQREQEQLLVQQSKLAALGEMIGAIAHQWKQPLNSASLYTQLIEDDYEFEELTKEKLSGYVREIMKQISFMAHTVEDFRNFFTPGKSEVSFHINKAVEDVIALLAPQFEKTKIDTVLSSPENDLTVKGYPNEFKQVILNLLTNAKDAVLSKRFQMPPRERKNVGRVEITIEKEGNEGFIRVSDDGGGIPEDALENIFQSYFTTKGEEGTGIGLYMSKMIVEGKMRGELSAHNTDKGALFTIKFPLD